MPGAISSAGKPVESRATAVGFALGLQFELIFQQLNLDQPQSTPDPRFRALREDRRSLRQARNDPPHAQTLDQAKPLLMNPFFLDRL
jgi:hypothetical protein